MMERDSYSLHGIQHHQYPLSLYNSHFMEPFISKGLLKAPPPLSLLHSAPPAPPQPPLLPLPASLPRRSYSCPAIKNGARKNRSTHGFTPKKSTKTSTKNFNNNIPKKEEKKTPKTSSITVKDDHRVVDMLPGSEVFAISPPPSSLPLPSFCLRPKLSCNAVAAGAADDLRRFLRLQ